MRLWTIQTREAWSKFQKYGKVRADSQIIYEDFMHAYLWMAKQMELRLSVPPSGVEYPVWAWFQWQDSARSRPDLRTSAHLPRDTEGIRLEFSAPASVVLLSDFDLWHYVLNNWYLPFSESDDLAFEAKFPDYHTSANADAARIVEQSWERIFDLEWFDPHITLEKSNNSIQATLWEIELSWISDINYFTVR